jgi:hypothetical protein
VSTRTAAYLTRAARKTLSAPDNNDSAIELTGTFLENCGAKLTEAVYPVMLRHGAADSWLDLELELWKVLTEIVKNGKQPTVHLTPVRS